MSADGSIELTWADAPRRFRIAIGEFRSLQESVNARRIAIDAQPLGPSALLNLLRTNNAWPDDVRDILKAGLIGGGEDYQTTNKLLVRNFDNKPLLEHTKTAFLILMAALVGAPDDEVGSKKKTETVTEKTGQFPSPSSTETEPQ